MLRRAVFSVCVDIHGGAVVLRTVSGLYDYFLDVNYTCLTVPNLSLRHAWEGIIYDHLHASDPISLLVYHGTYQWY